MTNHKIKLDRFFNRELSWLEFNQRVLDQTVRPDTPLLEQLKFLAITGSNLDEFFMVRVGGLKLQFKTNPDAVDSVGLHPDRQLELIRERVLEMVAEQYHIWQEKISPPLRATDVVGILPDQLSAIQIEHLRQTFEDEVLGTLSPLAVNSENEFPLLTAASLCLCVKLSGPSLAQDSSDSSHVSKDGTRYVVLPFARSLNRIYSVPSPTGFHYILLENLVAMFLDEIFPGQTILECIAFRALRNADASIDEEGADDLLSDMQEMLDARTTGECVRLDLAAGVTDATKQFLQSCLRCDDEDVYLIPGPLDLSALMALATIQGFSEHKFEAWPSQPSCEFSESDDLFATIAAEDRVLIHPYQAFDPVVDFLATAAEDDHVIAIKQTLYRTSRDSQIVASLQKAVEKGKHVTVVVELKARFDERRNILWAQQLEKAGAHVIYGVRGLKTHAKMCLVVRREPGGIKRYLHVGTGNYNESTARLYSDISLFTCDSQLGMDATNLFNAITGLSIPQHLVKVAAAPINLRSRLLELIEVEIANATNKRPAAIRAKVNSLVDPTIIEALYAASQAGVDVDLNVRGICCLRPQVPGLSERIRVVSIVDRLLEHARIFHFLHGGDHRTFIASADWMGRNLDRRVELMIPVEHPMCRDRLLMTLDYYFADQSHAQQLDSEGNYQLHMPQEKDTQAQKQIYRYICELTHSQQQASRKTFRPRSASPTTGQTR